MRNSILILLLLLLNACGQWQLVKKEEINTVSDLTIPEDSRFLYFKSIGTSRNNSATARKAAEDALFLQISRAVYQELSTHGIYLSNVQTNQIVQRIAVSGVLIKQDSEQRFKENYVLNRFLLKDKFAERTLCQITLLAQYSKADFMRAVKDAMNGRR